MIGCHMPKPAGTETHTKSHHPQVFENNSFNDELG